MDSKVVAALISALTALMGGLIVVFTWMSKTSLERKDDLIRAREARIKDLENQLKRAEDATPKRLQEWYESIEKGYEKAHDKLRVDLAEAISKCNQQELKIAELLVANKSLSEKELQIFKEVSNTRQEEIKAIQLQADQMKPVKDLSSTTDEQNAPSDPIGIALGFGGWLGNEILKTIFLAR